MHNFLNISLKKQEKMLIKIRDAEVLEEYLKHQYIPSAQTLALVVERIEQLNSSLVSGVISYPIRKAIEQGNIEQIRLLLPFHTYHPQSDLLWCLKHNRFEIFDVLLEHTQHNKQKILDKVLIDASLTDNVQAVEHVITQHADVSYFNLSALKHAIEAKSFKVVNVLIEHSDVAQFGSSALSLAARKNYPEIVEKLLNAGAAHDADNCVGFKSAVVHNNHQSIAVFLNQGKAFDGVMEEAFCSPQVTMQTLEMLWPHCDIEQVREKSHLYTNEGRERFDILYTQYQKNLLLDSVEGSGPNGRTRKM